MKDSEEVQKLLRLKRYESPGEEYFEKFAEDFKDRQRSELLRGSARSLLMERVGTWVGEMSPGRWAIPTAACAAAVAVGAFVVISPSGSGNLEDAIVSTPETAATLPDFPEASEEVIELSLPKPSTRIPGEAVRENRNVLTAGAGMGFREL